MIQLLKRMRRREALMALLCAVLVVGQVYFDLRLPDYMTELTKLIKTPGSSTGDILSVGGEMLLCTLCSAVLAVGCGYLSARTAAGFSFSVRRDLFHHVMDAGSEEMQTFSVPSLITRTTNDITQIQMIVAMGLQMLMKAPIMAVWAIIKILGKSWELSAVTAAFVVVICVTVITVMSICIPRFRIVQKLTDQINRVARENLTGINVVHAFNAEQYQNDKFNKPSLDMMNVQVKNQKLFALVQPTMTLGMNGLALTIYWLGAALVNNIALTDSAARLTMFSDVLVFSTYATCVVMSFMMLVMIFMLLPQAQVSAERINEVLERKANIREGSVSECKEHGTVEFKNVSFRYPHASEDELSNISFRVNRGETLAVIGATGSGKTTLVSLIPRFYDATEGEVLVDGVNVRDYTFDTLYNKLGYVTQKAVLFAGSIRDIRIVVDGGLLPRPGLVALVAAGVSIVVKEILYRYTVCEGRAVDSPSVVANAWHHRSDALSSVGTSVGIGGAILLGDQWTILDPLTAVAVSGFIVWEAVRLIRESVGDLLEASLPDEVEQQISRLVCEEPGVSGLHNLRTRRIGDHYAIEMHVRMPGAMTLYEAHRHATAIEQNIKHAFGSSTHVIVHLEPLKENGAYVEP